MDDETVQYEMHGLVKLIAEGLDRRDVIMIGARTDGQYRIERLPEYRIVCCSDKRCFAAQASGLLRHRHDRVPFAGTAQNDEQVVLLKRRCRRFTDYVHAVAA